MKQIYFIRHGQTSWNTEFKHQGGEHDIELNNTGIMQSIKSGIYLDKYQQCDKKFDLIITSPMKRAALTAEIIADKIGYNNDNIMYDINLTERLYGDIAGKTNHEIKNDVRLKEYYLWQDKWKNIIDPIERINKLEILDDKMHEMFGVETEKSVKERCKKVLDDIIGSKCEKILVVSHGGIINGFIKLMFNLCWELPKGKVSHRNCKIMLVEYNNGIYKLLSSMNDEHLDFIEC
jgi:broad specificity phosphatase PhoE